MSDTLDTARIDHLLNSELAGDITITVAGLGSGGTPVVQYLTMCGIRRWRLFDPDRLEPANLVKHPARRADLGRLKAEILCDWILDRNPSAEVRAHAEDVRMNPRFDAAVSESDLVICAVDSEMSREYVNDICVRYRTPSTTGLVFREGFGGAVFSFIPGQTGCYRCLQSYCKKAGLDLDDSEEMTPEEERQTYGLGNKFYQLSGLAVDIGTIAALHAHMSLSLLLGSDDASIPRLRFNWLVFANRRREGVFTGPFETKKIRLKPQDNCFVSCHRSGFSPEELRFYQTLRVPSGASLNRVKGSFKRLAKIYHPDRAAHSETYPDLAQDFVQIREAYEVLSQGQAHR